MKSVVIAGYARTPFCFTPKKGELIKVRPDDLAATAVKGVIQQTGIDANELEDLVLGCAFPEGEQGLNIS